MIEFRTETLNWCDVWWKIKVCSNVAFKYFCEFALLNCQLKHRLGVLDLTELEFLIHLIKPLNFFLVPVQLKVFIPSFLALYTIIKNPLCWIRDFNKVLNFFALRVMIDEVAESYSCTCKASVFLLCAFGFKSSADVLVDSFKTGFSADVRCYRVRHFLFDLIGLTSFKHFVVWLNVIFYCTLRGCLLNFTWFIHKIHGSFLCFRYNLYILHTVIQDIIEKIDISSIINAQVIFLRFIIDKNIVHSSSSIHWIILLELNLTIFFRLSVWLFWLSCVLGLEIALNFFRQLICQNSMKKLSLLFFKFLFYEFILGSFCHMIFLGDFVLLNLNYVKCTSFLS